MSWSSKISSKVIHFAFVSLLGFSFVGCEAVNRPSPTKPYGISRYKNPQANGEHFMKQMLDESSSAESSRPVVQSKDGSQSVVGSQSSRSSRVSGSSDLRSKYGLPHPDDVSPEDRKAMIRLYTEDCLRLQSL